MVPGMTVPLLIAINGDLASGKSSLAGDLSNRLGVVVVSTGMIHRAIAEHRGHSTLELNRIAEADAAIDDLVDGILQERGRSGESLILDSRLAFHFLPQSFKVHLTIDPKVGAKRALQRLGDLVEGYGSGPEALTQLEERRSSERARFLARYGVDIDFLRNYDLVVDTTSADTDYAAAIVLDHLNEGTAERDLAKGGPSLFLDPRRLLPSESTARLARPESKHLVEVVRSEGFRSTSSVSVGLAERFFFILDGHRRTSAAIVAGLPAIPCNLVAQDAEMLPIGISASQFMRSEISRREIYDWESAHRMYFTRYPFG